MQRSRARTLRSLAIRNRLELVETVLREDWIQESASSPATPFGQQVRSLE
ncbi:hypothetical protein QA600_21205 [Natronococcus sp. A-GB1]|nr:hypothetical protein [Natronococcus sp. A-GB1]MDG5761843.1 hypothetical protein [Natronococcus sp. A-GB1]